MEDHGVNPVQHRLGGDRLDHELGDAGVARLLHPRALGMAGHHDDRQIGIGAVGAVADHAGELHTVQREHVEVDDGQVDGQVIQHLQGLGAVVHLVDVTDARGLQNGSRNRAHVLVVVHQQNLKRFHRRHRGVSLCHRLPADSRKLGTNARGENPQECVT
ncbi:hypothetical protein MBEBAB_1606 [Brevundimonas abyssalis TAR-001]|uniref:Uncharacterized protein n=1 Tax=Brevundimonas abyssalis TAR-001 TaxID=1391729 RepID=A0A8E0NBL6_9CAUL|nr:hypothetical protein MBEBAB_1606 [Brevundimonas abyssalis TAR-001]